jgi:hypothetical protein
MRASAAEKLAEEMAGMRAGLAEQTLKARELELLKSSLHRPHEEGEGYAAGHGEGADVAASGEQALSNEQLQTSNLQLRRQMVEVAEEANRVQNELQTQLQGYELVGVVGHPPLLALRCTLLMRTCDFVPPPPHPAPLA